MSQTVSIMIVGVGGQGTLLASRVLGHLCTGGGYDVKVSEVHGMSQRGGSVVTYVRFGDRVWSPVADVGEADYILAFERLEAARWLPCLKKGGRLIVNDRRTSPMPVITGAMTYPEDIVEKLRALGADVTALDALTLAERAGSPKAVNVVLLGVLSRFMPEFSEAAWRASLEANVPAALLDVNEKAFEAGRAAV